MQKGCSHLCAILNPKSMHAISLFSFFLIIRLRYVPGFGGSFYILLTSLRMSWATCVDSGTVFASVDGPLFSPQLSLHLPLLLCGRTNSRRADLRGCRERGRELVLGVRLSRRAFCHARAAERVRERSWKSILHANPTLFSSFVLTPQL